MPSRKRADNQRNTERGGQRQCPQPVSSGSRGARDREHQRKSTGNNQDRSCSQRCTDKEAFEHHGCFLLLFACWIRSASRSSSAGDNFEAGAARCAATAFSSEPSKKVLSTR